jgi:hypothetical protein
MDEQAALLELPHAPQPATGYKQRAGRPRVKGCRTTSVNLSQEERELLERLAGVDDASLNDVWRRALRAYAVYRGLIGTEEVSAAA